MDIWDENQRPEARAHTCVSGKLSTGCLDLVEMQEIEIHL